MLAEMLGEIRADERNDRATVERVTQALCRLLARDNARFDAQRFWAVVRKSDEHQSP